MTAAAVAFVLSTLVVSAEQDWVEITTGQPFTDDITWVDVLADTDEIWVGTTRGEVFRSYDNGLTWETVFQPTAYDNLLDIQLKQLRTPTLNLDFLRDLRNDIPVRDREASNQRVLDLGGNLRGRQRQANARLLASLVANTAREPGSIGQISKCFDYIFIVAENGAYRASPGEPLRFDQLNTGQNLGTGRVTWFACDKKKPGHMLGKSAIGYMLETYDFGDSWFPYTTPFERGSKVNTAGFQDGRAVVLSGGRIYREREDRRGFDPQCAFIIDSVDSDPGWAIRQNGRVYGVTSDGIVVCEHNQTRRIINEQFARKVIIDFDVSGDHDENIMVATADDVYLSHDGGKTFSVMFTRRTQRSIDIVRVKSIENFENAIVWSGNVVYRRQDRTKLASETSVDVQEIYNQAPMWEVIEIGLRTYQTDGRQIGARRDDARLQGLLPLVRASYARVTGVEHLTAQSVIVSANAATDLQAFNYPNRDVWTVIASWDLFDIIRSASSTDRGWADVERLRRRMSYNLEDAYTRWANTSLELKRGGLTARQRGDLELQKREMAAYLNRMTDGEFEIFGGKSVLGGR